MNIDYHVLIDASQEDCPVPTIKAKEALDHMSGDEVLKLVTSQEGTVRNIRTLVRSHQYELLGEVRADSGFVFYIKKS